MWGEKTGAPKNDHFLHTKLFKTLVNLILMLLVPFNLSNGGKISWSRSPIPYQIPKVKT